VFVRFLIAFVSAGQINAAVRKRNRACSGKHNTHVIVAELGRISRLGFVPYQKVNPCFGFGGV
jgi:hypothetical protein